MKFKKYLKAVISGKTKQAHPAVGPSEEPGVASASGNQRTSNLPSASSVTSTTGHPVGCETLIEGASPIVAE
jgi:hypothetical protein